ncbi:carbohydrate ABC transporter permease [Ructibacterium gallinarum]|uniref:Carbohydrate ABC transporter permease n=1 Tax=Ructibacterium gallinarum TaxID=2779355 RepID=A0A9D5M268_9FIRM|nr:carbohydrate ABC transporter permease [Ructibacterium gallinarum]MBE5039329.1 carbohydrate ABC transporter permease [Ructibacterium gallinarum]
MRESRGEKILGAVNYILLTLIAVLCVYPLIYILSASFSSSSEVLSGNVILLPKGLTTESYRRVLSNSSIWISYANTIFYTVAGVAVSMVLTTLGAYALSKKRLMGRRFFGFFISLTLWFQAGTIPTYLNIVNLNMLDTRWAILIPFALSTFNVIVLRTYFEGIPDALEEAARMDGAGDPYILFKIYLPLAMPSLATIALFYAVSRWNGYFWAMVLLQTDSKVPLQVVLKKMIVEISAVSDSKVDMTQKISQETFIYATIVISILPMLIFYPFIQKYFIKGMTVGAVKG